MSDFDPAAYLAEKRAAQDFDPAAYLAEKRAKPKEAPGLVERGARWLGNAGASAAKYLGDVGSSAAAGAASLAQVADPLLAAAGTASSYLVPYTAPEGASVGERFKNEMEGIRRTRAEMLRKSPNAFMAGAILEGGAQAPLLAKAAPFSAQAPTTASMGGTLGRAGAALADASLFSGLSNAGSNIDREPGKAFVEGATSPANLIAPGIVGAGELAPAIGQAVKPAVVKLLTAPLPKVKPTESALRLRREGVPLTLGQNNPDTFYAAFEQATADNPLGMHIEHGIAKDAARNVAIDRVRPQGVEPVAPGGSTQERLAATRQAFNEAYAPVKDVPVDPDIMSGLPQRALTPPKGGGVSKSVREAAAAKIDDALTTIPGYEEATIPASEFVSGRPFETPSETRVVPMPSETKLKGARIPSWLDPEDFYANRAAWDYTWKALGGPNAPEVAQKLVYDQMLRAVGGADDFAFGANQVGGNDFSLKRGYALARLLQGKGGKNGQFLREQLEKWAAMPEGSRPADPIPEKTWGKLIDTTRKDVAWGRGNKYGDLLKVDTLEKWLRDARAQVERTGPYAVLDKPFDWYGEAPPPAGAEGATAEPSGPQFKVGDLIKARSNMRDARRAAVARGDDDMEKALNHGIQIMTDAIEASLEGRTVATPDGKTVDARDHLRATDKQYRDFNVVEGAAAKGGPDSDFSPRNLASVLPRTHGRRAVVEGKAGDLQDLAQAGAETFDTRVKPTGMRGLVVEGIPKRLRGPTARLLNQPSVKAAILGEAAPSAPVTYAPRLFVNPRALTTAAPFRWRLPGAVPFGAEPLPAGAEDDR